jgi:hypothetical protein
MSDLLDDFRKMILLSDELWDTGKRVARELQRVIDPIIPGLSYSVLQANSEGEFCVYICHYGREPNPYPYSQGKMPLHGVIEDALADFDEEYPELVWVSRHIDSDVWISESTAQDVGKALQKAIGGRRDV